MRASEWAALVKLSLARDKRFAVSSAFGITVGVASLVFFVGLGLGIGKLLREKVFPVDARLVEVVPPKLALGGLLGGGTIDETTVKRLSELPGVAQAFRKMNVRVPAVSRYDGDFFGRPLRMGLEVLAVGVDPALVKGDLLLGDFKDPGPSQPIPAVAASRLLEIYNKSFAPARGLPNLTPQLVTGLMIPVEFNRSFVTSSPGGTVTASQLQLVGVSQRGLLAGVTIPLETAKRINRASGVDAETFTAVTLLAASPGDVPGIVSAVKGLGLQVDDEEQQLAQNAAAVVVLITAAMALLSGLICLLAAVNIAHALAFAVRARARDIGIMRAVGASQADIRNWVLGEAAALGLVGGVVGTMLAIGAAVGIDIWVTRALPPFPFKPETFFDWPAWLWGAGVLLGTAAAFLGAWGPGRQAARIDPAAALAG